MLQRIKTFLVKTSILWKDIKSFFWVYSSGLYFKHILKTRYNIVKLKTFKFKDWHLGSKYFVGYHVKKEKYVFIKTCNSFDIIEREITAIKHIVTQDGRAKRFTPNIIASNKKTNYPFVALDFIKGVTLEDYLKQKNQSNENLAEKIIEQFSDLAEILCKSNIIHRDIRPANIMISLEEERIYLIDFAFAITENKQLLPETNMVLKHPKILESLGDEFKPDKYLWDDAYSINMLVELISKKFNIKNSNAHDAIKRKIGKLSYEYLENDNN